MASPFVGGEMGQIGPWLPGEDSKNFRRVKSAERTLAIFELFSLHQRSMGVGEIARALEIPQPSASMLIRDLCNLGYLQQDPQGRRYSPTIRIMLLGSWIHRRFGQQDNLERRLDALVDRLDEGVIMGIQNGIYSQYISFQSATAPNRMEVQSGFLRPITRTALGRMLLSLKPDDEVLALARRCNAQVADERLRVRPAEFMELIRRIRAQGYAQTAGDMTPGWAVIAVSIQGPPGNMPMAVGVGGELDRIAAKQEQILAALREFKAAGEG